MSLNNFINILLDSPHITITRMDDKVIFIDNDGVKFHAKIEMLNNLKGMPNE